MARRDAASRYRYELRHELEEIESFLKKETGSAESLVEYCRLKNIDLDEDEYRAVVFLRSGEYGRKLGSLALLYQTGKRLDRELPASTKETIIDIVRFRFRMYSAVLREGGFD